MIQTLQMISQVTRTRKSQANIICFNSDSAKPHVFIVSISTENPTRDGLPQTCTFHKLPQLSKRPLPSFTAQTDNLGVIPFSPLAEVTDTERTLKWHGQLC